LDTSVSTVVGLQYRRPGFDSRQGQECFSLPPRSGPTLGPAQSPIQWGLEAFFAKEVEKGCQNVNLTTCLYLVLRLRMHGAVHGIVPSSIRLHSVVRN